MNLIDGLKAVAPAVGDGKIVSLHAYVMGKDNELTATNGRLWARATVDGLSGWEFVVRHEPLIKTMSREGAIFRVTENGGLKVSAGRSRVTLKGVDCEDFPAMPTGGHVMWVFTPPPEFKDVLKNLYKFCAGNDGHIWQQGVHFTSDMAFAANSHAAASYSHGWGLPAAFTLPPWAIDFLLAQSDSPDDIRDHGNVFSFGCGNEMQMVSTKLIEEPPANMANFVLNIVSSDLQEVPPNLKEVVERAASYDVDKFKLGNGWLVHRTDEMTLEDEIDLNVPVKVWGTKTMLAALDLATHIDLSAHPARWKGGQYVGAFSGLSGSEP